MKTTPKTHILITDEPCELERHHDPETLRFLGRLLEPFEPFVDLLS